MIALAALAVVGQASGIPSLHSLLVGLSRTSDKRVLAPRGAVGDVTRMRAICHAYGESPVSSLLGEAADASAIREGLSALAAKAKGGDVCLFYYSGLGSGKGAEPTLVAADGTADSAAKDVTLAEVAAWAQSVAAKGARPVIVLDASWPTRKDVSALDEKDFHPYDAHARCVVRARTVVDPLAYTGPGVLLAAGGAGGRTYDWQVSEESWSGAFTDLVGQAVVAAGLRDERVVPDTLVASIRRSADEFRDAGYIPDLKPVLLGDGKPPLMGRAPELGKDERTREVVAAERQRLAKYRVALAVDADKAGPEEKARIYQSARLRFGQRLTEASEVAFCTPGTRPDAVVHVKETDGDLTFRLPDDDTRPKSIPSEYTVAELDRMVPWLQRQALLARLFRLADAAQPTLTEAIQTNLPLKPETGSELKAQATAPAKGFVFVMDRGAALNVVHLYTPNFKFLDASSAPGKPLAVAPGARFSEEVGPHEWRVVAVESAPGFTLPPLRDKRLPFEDDLVPYLRALLKAIDSGQVRWTAHVQPYTVVPAKSAQTNP